MLNVDFYPVGNTLVGRAELRSNRGPIAVEARIDKHEARAICEQKYGASREVNDFLELDEWNPSRVAVGEMLGSSLPLYHIEPPVKLTLESGAAYAHAFWLVAQARLFNPVALTGLVQILNDASRGDITAKQTMALIELVDSYAEYIAQIRGVELLTHPRGGHYAGQVPNRQTSSIEVGHYEQGLMHKSEGACCDSCATGGPCGCNGCVGSGSGGCANGACAIQPNCCGA